MINKIFELFHPVNLAAGPVAKVKTRTEVA